jgi:zinc protease
MKRSCLLLLMSCAVLGVGAAGAATPAAPASPNAPRMIVLRNGVRALLAPDARAAAVDVAVWCEAGVRYERPGNRGISSLVMHLSGYGAAPGGEDELRRLIEGAGGNSVSYTNADFTCFSHTVPRAALELAVRLEAGRFGLRTTQRMLDQARVAVREENRARAASNLLEPGFQRLYATVFPAHPYRWPVFGSDQDVSRITVGDCEQFLRGRYTPDHILLTVVGDFDPDQASDALRRWFEPLRGRGERATTVAEPQPRGERRAAAHGDVAVPVLIVGWRAPAGASGDAPALDVLSVLLSAKSAGRLNRRLVSGDQASRFAQTGRDGRRDGTMFWAAAAPRSERDTAAFERALVGEIEKLATEPVSGEELDRARRQLEVALLLGRQTARDRGQALGTSQIITGDWSSADRQLERLRALTPADLQQAAARILTPARRTVVWMTPRSDGAVGGGGQR